MLKIQCLPVVMKLLQRGSAAACWVQLHSTVLLFAVSLAPRQPKLLESLVAAVIDSVLVALKGVDYVEAEVICFMQ